MRKNTALMIMMPALCIASTFDPLTTRWTFGAHEPYTMYRRVGRHCTGGIDGNAKWVKPWLDWFDSESPTLMEELGLNGLHSRFYKGMGWEEEKKDFPNVKKFVANCHKHGVMALAYVQFSTLYPEPMMREIPDLENWAQVDENGNKRTYNATSYFRWLPCVTCDEWVEYTARMCKIALAEGGFDGIMFDNCTAMSCYCERCERKFHEYLMSLPDPAERFGFDDISKVRQPRAKTIEGEIRDPVIQAWVRWRQKTFEDVLARLCATIKSVKPDAVVSANPQPFRSHHPFVTRSLNMNRVAHMLDMILLQSDNFPEVLSKGEIVNRVRDLKLAHEVGRPVVALCDSDAMMTEARERHYLLPLLEDLIWGGIPTDRTIISPKAVPGFVDRGKLERRRPQLAAFNAFAAANKTTLSSASWQPVRLLWTPDTIGFSLAAHQGLAAAEEIMLRNQVPFGYIISTAEAPFAVPADCEVVVVPNQTCLSDAQIDALVAFAKKGGKLVVTGDSGRYDEWNAQRLENPLLPCLAGLPNVACRADADILPSAHLGWRYRIAPPKDGGKALMADLAKTGWTLPVKVSGAPAHVFAEYKRTPKGYAVHLLNYNPDIAVPGISVTAPSSAKVRYQLPFDGGAQGTGGTLPTFSKYALVEVDRQ